MGARLDGAGQRVAESGHRRGLWVRSHPRSNELLFDWRICVRAPHWERSITFGGPRRCPNGPPAAVPPPMGAWHVPGRHQGLQDEPVRAVGTVVTDLTAEIRALKAERGAAILAHNYQRPEVQDVADVVADSLKMARRATELDAPVLVICGVHFMAETAAIANPDKKVLIPDLGAGCSLADTIRPGDVRAWRADHPDGLVVAYA